MRKDISIVHLKAATVVDSKDHFITFDHKAGESMREITCVYPYKLPVDFITELLATKIVTLVKDSLIISSARGNEYTFFTLLPQFPYTNQRFEDVLCNLFEKFEM